MYIFLVLITAWNIIWLDGNVDQDHIFVMQLTEQFHCCNYKMINHIFNLSNAAHLGI